MAKTKSVFVCQNCGSQSPKWIGKCTSCNEWNTFVEEIIEVKPKAVNSVVIGLKSSSKPQLITQIEPFDQVRIDTQNNEFNRVLGGGIVPGSLILIGGEPGIGKSTLSLQIALSLKDQKTLYISGEESPQQIKLRADRIGIKHPTCYILGEVSLESIIAHIHEHKPDIVVIDSIQTIQTDKLESSPGTVGQIRESAAMLQRLAKSTSIPIILIGHINKDGNIAGPKVLEHIVDIVLQFEGDHNNVYRILRATKNRFGSTSEIGIFEMMNSGLREVPNPSELLISHTDDLFSGVAISCCIEGIRPILIEIQALVSSAVYGTPQRSSTGFDTRRLNMLLAVLEKKAGFKLGQKDVFLNIAGGIKVSDPAIDLAVAGAILSSNLDVPLGKRSCFAGEISLTGEIKPVGRIEQRIAEAAKLGYEQVFISKYNKKNIVKNGQIEIVYVSKIEHLLNHLNQ